MKKVLVTLIALFLFMTPIYAQIVGPNSEGYDRNSDNNYGVSKFSELKDEEAVKNTPYVDPSLKIYDYADILTTEEEKELKELIGGFIEQTGLDFVFVSTNFAYNNDYMNEEEAMNFYDYNDFGMNLTHHGGLILFRNTWATDPYYSSVLTGEAQLYCDEDCNDYLLDNIYNDFHSGNYKGGITNYIHMFNSRYEQGYDPNERHIDENGSLVKVGKLNPIPSFITGAVATILGMLGLVNKNKMVKKASNANDYLVESSIEFLNKKDQFINSTTTQTRVSSSSSGGSHRGFGSSGAGHISGGRHG